MPKNEQQYAAVGTDESAEVAHDTEEIDAPFTVDWTTPPDRKLAERYRETLMARCEIDPDGMRDVLDVAAGYEAIKDEDIHKWPLWETSRDELGKIGGPGVLVYFELLFRLPIVFAVMAVLNTPNLYLNMYGEDNMYDSELLTRQYKTWTARSTLGSVYAKQQTLETEAGMFEGHAGGMWVRTVLDSVSVLFPALLRHGVAQAALRPGGEGRRRRLLDGRLHRLRPPARRLAGRLRPLAGHRREGGGVHRGPEEAHGEIWPGRHDRRQARDLAGLRRERDHRALRGKVRSAHRPRGGARQGHPRVRTQQSPKQYMISRVAFDRLRVVVGNGTMRISTPTWTLVPSW